jgi:hypothetical protein
MQVVSPTFRVPCSFTAAVLERDARTRPDEGLHEEGTPWVESLSSLWLFWP